MRIRIVLVLAMALLVTGLLWLNHAHPVTPSAPPASPRAALPNLPAHFAGHAQNQSDESPATNLFRLALKGGDFPKLTAEQVAGYLQANHRNSESLLGALYSTGDRVFLREALTNFPNDPKVNYAALYFGMMHGDLSPEDARQLSDNFKRVAPDNSMADYTSALNYMKSGQPDLAMQDMAAAAKATWTDYSSQFLQSSEEAYRSAGFSDLDAKAASSSQLLLPDLAPLKQLGKDMAALATSYQQAGDSTSAQATLQMDMQLGQQLSASDTQPLITTLVGIAIERIALGGMDPSAPYGDPGQTVQDQINQLQQQRDYIRTVSNQYQALQPTMSDEDILNFLQRRQNFGPLNAMQWAANKYSSQ